MKKESRNVKQVRTRAAPSPTGMPHLGSLRAFLMPWLAAKRLGGKFILRIEDTDQKRYVENGIEILRQFFIDYDLIPDEGPGFGGDLGPYIQSERKDLYRSYAEELINKDAAYYCFCSAERLEELRKKQQMNKVQTRYDKHCLKTYTKEEAQKKVDAGESHVVRLNVPSEGICEFEDVVFGKLKIPYKSIDDQVLLKSDSLPTYHFGVVIDDHLMQITHVLRGEEYISSTPKDILMYKAFGWEIPLWVHMPMIVGDNGKKFGKRNGSLPAVEYLEKGYLKEAIINYVALLGWSPGEDLTVMDRETMIKKFELKRIQKSPAKFDPVKFEWINGEHIRTLKLEDLTDRVLEWLKKYDEKIDKDLRGFLMKDTGLKNKVALVQERTKTLLQIAEQLRFFYVPPTDEDYQASEIVKTSDQLIKELIEVHEKVEIKDQEAWENAVRGLAESCSYKAGDVFMQIRVAVVGSRFSPPLRESLEILGKEEVLKRLKNYGGL